MLSLTLRSSADGLTLPHDSYHADPSGTFVRYDAKAIGSGSEGAQGELQDKYNKVSKPGTGTPPACVLGFC